MHKQKKNAHMAKVALYYNFLWAWMRIKLAKER